MTHATYIETVPGGFAVVVAERDNDSRRMAVTTHAAEAWEFAEKAAPAGAIFDSRPDWLVARVGHGGAFVWGEE